MIFYETFYYFSLRRLAAARNAPKIPNPNPANPVLVSVAPVFARCFTCINSLAFGAYSFSGVFDTIINLVLFPALNLVLFLSLDSTLLEEHILEFPPQVDLFTLLQLRILAFLPLVPSLVEEHIDKQ